jgi:hypothetical protein
LENILSVGEIEFELDINEKSRIIVKRINGIVFLNLVSVFFNLNKDTITKKSTISLKIRILGTLIPKI